MFSMTRTTNTTCTHTTHTPHTPHAHTQNTPHTTHQTTDRDLESVSAMKRKMNAWICAPRKTDHDPANAIFNKICNNCNVCNVCNVCNFSAAVLFSNLTWYLHEESENTEQPKKQYLVAVHLKTHTTRDSHVCPSCEKCIVKVLHISPVPRMVLVGQFSRAARRSFLP